MVTTGELSFMAPVEPWKAAAPKLNTPPSAAPSQYPSRPPLGVPTTENQSDLRPSTPARESPVTCTDPALPFTTTPVARPPSAAWAGPDREVTCSDRKVPMDG